MILASDLQTDLDFLLDDENSERYSFANDHQPAINAAVRYIMSAFDQAFDRGVLAPTIFSELLYGLLFTPTSMPGVDAVKVALTNPLFTGERLWRLVGVDPAPVISGTTDYVMAGTRLAKFIPFIDSGGVNDDPFEPGYTGVAADINMYSYTHINTIDPDGTPAQYLVIRPAPVAAKVGVIHLRTPAIVTTEESEVEFPYVLYQPVLMKAYQYIMIQGGPQAQAAWQISDKDVQELVSLFR